MVGGVGFGAPLRVLMSDLPGQVEITTAADDEVTVHVRRGGTGATRVVSLTGLSPSTEVDIAGVTAKTLARPPGQLLATFATVNDLHLGEKSCGLMQGVDMPPGTVLSSGPGEDPYPQIMSAAAVGEISAVDPLAVIAKGDLTDAGREDEWLQFREIYQDTFGERLYWTCGNHDVSGPDPVRAPPAQEIVLPGLRIALLDTSVPGEVWGRLSIGQLEWLDELAARSDRPVLVAAHHEPLEPSGARPASYGGLDPESSEALVALGARRPGIVGFVAGHTHRNRLRRFPATGEMPWVEVAAVKDYPGSWAEYRVFDGGVLQVHRRISAPAALAWSDRCRAMFGGMYPAYAMGELSDRCFAMYPRA